MTGERVWTLRNQIAEQLEPPEVDGVVVTHGTDTLDESAYLNARTIASEQPIVFTGAMRAASEVGWDAASKSTLHASPRAQNRAAVGHSDDRRPRVRVRCHTYLLDAFESPGLGPRRRDRWWRGDLPPPVAGCAARARAPAAALPVDIVSVFAAADARLLAASRATR
jgi:L-asparaginase